MDENMDEAVPAIGTIIIEHGDPAYPGPFNIMQAHEHHGYRSIMCPTCQGAAIWRDPHSATRCNTCLNRGVVVLKFRLDA